MDMVLLFALVMVCVAPNIVFSRECNNYRPCRLKTKELLQHPEQLISQNQHLEVTLKIQMSEVTVGGWLKLWRRTYNNKLGGPTMRVKPGDTVVVNLVNTLEPNAKDSPHNTLRLANSTNLFLHGLHVSPQNNDITLRANPGEMRRYVYKIDCNHPPGTFWFHPHLHGSAMFQTISGMAGMIVVEDTINKSEVSKSLASVSCPYHCEHEIHLLFQPTMLYKTETTGISFPNVQKLIRDSPAFRNKEKISPAITLNDWLKHPENKIKYFTTNGQLQPLIRIKAGQMKRVRMVNAGGIHILEIDTPRSNSGKECDVLEIAKDGVYLQRPRKQQNGQTIIVQGGTVEWLILCDAPGVYQIISNPRSDHNASIGEMERIRTKLASIEVVSVAPKYRKSAVSFKNLDALPISLPSLPKTMADVMDVKERDISGRFVVETARNNILNREEYPAPPTVHIRHKMSLGGVQEWTLLNADPENSHTIHVPGNHFQVISYNKYRGPISSYVSENNARLLDQLGRPCKYKGRQVPKRLAVKKSALANKKYTLYDGDGFADVGEWRNTLLMPRLSNITIRFIPRQFTGKIFVHSHNLQRADSGMIMVTEIVEKGRPTNDVTVAVNGSVPGTCRSVDFYPTVSVPLVSVASHTLNDFFLWLYKYKPAYLERYGDQRYLTGLYGAFLDESGNHFSTGNHLRDFFDWTYDKFPSYKAHYGDQGYLFELYNYYITHEVAVKSVKKSSLG